VQAVALVGLAEVLSALDQTRDAYQSALEASKLVADLPAEEDPVLRREHILLAAQIDNSLAVSSIALGQYQDALRYLVEADKRLRPYGDSAAELRRKNQQSLHLLSRVKVYRALLNKAEAEYAEAAERVREGRQLREQLDESADLLAYHLAEASIQLARARSLVQEQSTTAAGASASAALDEAEAALKRAEPFIKMAHGENESPQAAAALPYRYLRGLLLRMRGDREAARAELAARIGPGQRSAERRQNRGQVLHAAGPIASGSIV
jgi:hypothetical protein